CGARLGKTGAGTLILSGTNTFADSTTIVEGSLQIDGTLTTSATSITAGGTLSGTGHAADVMLLSGGRLSPGDDGSNDGVGTRALHDLSWSGGGHLVAQVSHDAGMLDHVSVSSLLPGTAGSPRVRTVIAGAEPLIGEVYTLIQCSTSCGAFQP